MTKLWKVLLRIWKKAVLTPFRAVYEKSLFSGSMISGVFFIHFYVFVQLIFLIWKVMGFFGYEATKMRLCKLVQ